MTGSRLTEGWEEDGSGGGGGDISFESPNEEKEEEEDEEEGLIRIWSGEGDDDGTDWVEGVFCEEGRKERSGDNFGD